MVVHGSLVSPNTSHGRLVEIIRQRVIRWERGTHHAHFGRHIGYRHTVIYRQRLHALAVIFYRLPVHVKFPEYTFNPQCQVLRQNTFRQAVFQHDLYCFRNPEPHFSRLPQYRSFSFVDSQGKRVESSRCCRV